MGVRIALANTMEQPVVVGDLSEVVNAMNIASAQGMNFIICERPGGHPIAIKMSNITMLDQEDDDAIIG